MAGTAEHALVRQLQTAATIGGLALWRHHHEPTVTSTNALLLDAADADVPGNVWLSADEQTAGRGRRGRVWSSPRNNLYASVLIVEAVANADMATLPLMCAVAARDAIAACLPETRRDDVRIKWPNDILIDARKCAGLLLESRRLPDGRLAIVAGFGVNVGDHPDDTPYPATSMAAQGSNAEPMAVFEALAGSFAHWLDIWRGADGIARTREQWLRHCHGLGERITVRLLHEEKQGVFVTIDADGFLVLEADNGTKDRIAAGDVFFASAASMDH